MFETTITVPAATPSSAPVSKEVTLPVSVITKVRARVPGVSSGELGFRLSAQGAVFAPDPASDLWIVHDVNAPATIEWEEDRPIPGRTAKLLLEAYNTSAAQLVIRFDLVIVAELVATKAIALITKIHALLASLGYATAPEKPPKEEPAKA